MSAYTPIQYSFACHDCGREHVAPNTATPAGWDRISTTGGGEAVLCPDCRLPDPAAPSGRLPLYPHYRLRGVRPEWEHTSMVTAGTGDLLRRIGVPDWGDPLEAVAWFRPSGQLAILVADFEQGRRVTVRAHGDARNIVLGWWNRP